MKQFKLILLTVSSLGLFSCSQGVKKSDLKTTGDKSSYAIGLEIGGNLKQQDIDINTKAFMQGLKDGLTGDKKAAKLSPEEIQQTMQSFQTEMMAKQQKKMQKMGVVNKKKSQEFLAQNRSKPGIVSLPDGLQYQVLKSGNGASPTLADEVTFNYVGTLVDGTEFDNSYKRGQALTIPLKGNIPGLAEAMQKMKVGDTWKIFIPSELAYGEMGGGQIIGPNSAIILQVELLKVTKK